MRSVYIMNKWAVPLVKSRSTVKWLTEIIVFFLFFSTVILHGINTLPKKVVPTTTHKLHVFHPGNIDKKKVPCTLIQRFDQQKKYTEFYMDVRSVYCEEEICKIVPVRIFWDELGYYKKYELAAGIELEKAQGKPFAKEDHDKLHQVLSDRSSPLGNVKSDDIKNHENISRQVDAVTGATPESYAGTAVPGAALTSYTLWHWANSKVCDEIEKITAAACSLDDLIACLKNDRKEGRIFAIKQLIERKAFEPPLPEIVIMQALQQGQELTELALQYIDQAPDDLYCTMARKFFQGGNQQQRITILSLLLKTKRTLPPDYVDQFSHELNNFQSYLEVNMLLTLFKQQHPNSTYIIEQAAKLLESDNFLVARRAYWFLQMKKLNASQQEKVDAFVLQNRGRL